VRVSEGGFGSTGNQVADSGVPADPLDGSIRGLVGRSSTGGTGSPSPALVGRTEPSPRLSGFVRAAR
jgi:hypothetical protein